MSRDIDGWWKAQRDPRPWYSEGQLRDAIERSRGNVAKAARIIGCSLKSFKIAVSLTPNMPQFLAATRRAANLQRMVRDAEIFVRLHDGIPWQGRKIGVAEAAQLIGLSQLVITRRVKAGLPPELIMRAPPKQTDEPDKGGLYYATFAVWKRMMLDLPEDQVAAEFRQFATFLLIAGEKPGPWYVITRPNPKQPIGPPNNFAWTRPRREALLARA
jgi:hypothetical protein